MARCEDFPCCGHESGCCPDRDSAGRQLNMKCVCGATVPLGSRTSLCNSCINDPDDDDYREDWGDEDDWDENDWAEDSHLDGSYED